MSPELWIALIGQTLVLLFAIVGFALRGEHRLTKLEGRVEHIERVCNTVPEMSRSISRIEGRHKEIDARLRLSRNGLT